MSLKRKNRYRTSLCDTLPTIPALFFKLSLMSLIDKYCHRKNVIATTYFPCLKLSLLLIFVSASLFPLHSFLNQADSNSPRKTYFIFSFIYRRSLAFFYNVNKNQALRLLQTILVNIIWERTLNIDVKKYVKRTGIIINPIRFNQFFPFF